jgi:hypothetical protein
MFGMIVGTIAGAYSPMLWGVSAFSMTSLLGSFVGGILGIWLAFRFTD